MADPPQPQGPAHSSPKQGKDPALTDPATTTGPGGSPRNEDLHHEQILAHARSATTPPAIPCVTNEIEVDITSPGLTEDPPKVYIAERQTRPLGLTEGEIARIINRLEVDLEFAYRKIKKKSQQKPWVESLVMIEMRMGGTLERGSTKVTLRPCIWIFCGSKWCKKIVKRLVEALNWFGPYKVYFVRKGGPQPTAGDGRSAGVSNQAIRGHSSPVECLNDGQDEHSPRLAVPTSGETVLRAEYYDPIYTRTPYDPTYSGEDQNDDFIAPGSYAALESSSATHGSTGAYNPYPTTSATSSTGGYEYQSYLSGAPAYSSYSSYGGASVANSSVPMYGEGGSESVWSDSPSHATGASSAPSTIAHHTDVNNTINRQAPPNQVYQLPCELRNLTDCNVTFPGDDEQGWTDHIERHLGGTFPSKLRCWFCNDHYFDARQTSGGDLRYNFTSRMQHIRHHIVYEGFRPDQMLRDGHVLQHLFDRNLIDRRTYDRIINPATEALAPGTQGNQSRQGYHRSHRSHHSHLPRVVQENVPGESRSRSHRSSDHRSDRHRSDHTRRGHERSHGSSHRREPDIPSTSYQGRHTTRNRDYAHPFASLSLNDRAPVAPDTGTDRSTHQPASIQGRIVKTAESSNNNVLRNTVPVTSSATPADMGGLVSGRLDSVRRDPKLKGKPNQHDHPASSSAEHHDSFTALRGHTEHRLHVRVQGLRSLIGLSCISTTWKGDKELSRSTSKVGGVISITIRGHAALYGVTAGHSLFHQKLNIGPQSAEDTSTGGLSDDSDSFSEDDEDSPTGAVEGIYSGDSESTDSAVDLNDHATWTPIECGITAEFLGIGLSSDSETESEPDQSNDKDTLSGDIALCPIDPFNRLGLANHYTDPWTQKPKEVTSISENEIESTLPVVVLLGPEQTVSGVIQPTKFHFSMRGTAIDARQVRLSRNLAPGSSGSWVVHDQTLYGMIVAVFPGECMAVMIPSKRMTSDVRKLCPGATDISVAIKH